MRKDYGSSHKGHEMGRRQRTRSAEEGKLGSVYRKVSGLAVFAQVWKMGRKHVVYRILEEG